MAAAAVAKFARIGVKILKIEIHASPIFLDFITRRMIMTNFL